MVAVPGGRLSLHLRSGRWGCVCWLPGKPAGQAVPYAARSAPGAPREAPAAPPERRRSAGAALRRRHCPAPRAASPSGGPEGEQRRRAGQAEESRSGWSEGGRDGRVASARQPAGWHACRKTARAVGAPSKRALTQTHCAQAARSKFCGSGPRCSCSRSGMSASLRRRRGGCAGRQPVSQNTVWQAGRRGSRSRTPPGQHIHPPSHPCRCPAGATCARRTAHSLLQDASWVAHSPAAALLTGSARL